MTSILPSLLTPASATTSERNLVHRATRSPGQWVAGPPRLAEQSSPAQALYHHLEKYRSGELSDRQFTKRFETLLQKQHAWLAKRGVSGVRAAVAIHAGVLVLSLPGLRAEAVERSLPLEVVEQQAVSE